LQAGRQAFKGEFEKRLQGVIDPRVKAAVKPIICSLTKHHHA